MPRDAIVSMDCQSKHSEREIVVCSSTRITQAVKDRAETYGADQYKIAPSQVVAAGTDEWQLFESDASRDIIISSLQKDRLWHLN